MTAPDQPNPKEILSSCQPGLRNPVTLPTSGNDLRDRIRDAFHTIVFDCVDYHATDCTDCTTRADAVMSDIQRALDAKDAEIARQAADADRLDELLIDERATTARLGRELGRLRDQQNGHQT